MRVSSLGFFKTTNKQGFFWLSLQMATIQHPIKLILSTCFSLFLSDCTTPLDPPPPQPTAIAKGVIKDYRGICSIVKLHEQRRRI
jgi:hypothetical protein